MPDSKISNLPSAAPAQSTDELVVARSGDNYKLTIAEVAASMPSITTDTVNATTGNITTVNATTVDTTNIEVTNIKAKDGTSTITIADSTGVVTVSAAPVMSALTASQAVFTTAGKALVSNPVTGTGNVVMSASPTLTGTVNAAAATLSGNLTLNGGTASGVLYLNGSKVATSGSALVFDGTNLLVGTATTANNLRNSEKLAVVSTGNGNYGGIGISNYGGTSNAIAATIDFNRSRGTTDGSMTAVASNDVLGYVIFRGSDGTGFSNGAYISGEVDGTVATNQVPGRLQFFTANSSGAVTEKMRIDSSGNLGLGVTPGAWNTIYKAFQNGQSSFMSRATGDDLYINANAVFESGGWKYITSNFSSRYEMSNGTHSWYTAPSGTAGNAITFSQAMTLDASGNLGIGRAPNYTLDVYRSGTTTPTIAAANDNIVNVLRASGSTEAVIGPITSHPLVLLSANTERMRIDATGNVGIGAATTSGVKVLIGGTLPSATATTRALLSNGTVPSSTTSNFRNISSAPSTEAASFTLATLHHFHASQGSLGAGSAVTDQAGFVVGSNMTGATTNYGFYSQLPAGSGRYNFYAQGTADNYMAGSLGLGGTPGASTKLQAAGTYPVDSGLSRVFVGNGIIPSGATTAFRGFDSNPSTAAASFTCTDLQHFYASQGSLGAGSAVTNQYGFIVANNLTGATNNYGFYSDIASGSNRWNFYAGGTAQNYFAGDTGIGRTPTAGYKLDVAAGTAEVLIESTTGTNQVDANLINTSGTFAIGIDSSTGGVYGTAYARAIFATGAYPVVIFTNSTERMRITSAGNIVAGASAALATTATDGFLYVPTCAGTPTGTPTAITGMAPSVVNTTNNKLYFYSGGAGRDAGP